MSNLNGKKIALICPNFFNYSEEIYTELVNLGAIVTLYDERPSNDIITKALIRSQIHHKVSFIFDRYFKSITEKMITINFDIIFFVNPESIPIKYLSLLKSRSSKTKIIIYMWDSISNKPYTLNYIELSDEFYTFDSTDADTYNVKCIPLFYTRSYTPKLIHDKSMKYDCCFIGTIHSERYDFVSEIKDKNKNKKIYTFFYCPSRLLFFYKKYISKELHNVPWCDISFKPKSVQEIIDIYNMSNSIIDICHSSQSGLTVRTFEAVGMTKKLITNNNNIIYYDIYSSNNVYLLDESYIIPNDFLSSDYIINNEVYLRYSISSWLNEILSD